MLQLPTVESNQSAIQVFKRMARPMRGHHAAITVASFLLLLLLAAAVPVGDGAGTDSGGDFSGGHNKLSGIIIPGFASTQLRAWSILDCPYSPLDFNPLDLVWLDTTKVSRSFCSYFLFFCYYYANRSLNFLVPALNSPIFVFRFEFGITPIRMTK